MNGDNESDWLRIFAIFRWKRLRLVANNSWIKYDISCRRKESNNFTWPWFNGKVTVFPGKDELVPVECAFINRSSHTLPLILDLVMNISAIDSLKSSVQEQEIKRRVEVFKWVDQASVIKNLALSLPPISASNKLTCTVYVHSCKTHIGSCIQLLIQQNLLNRPLELNPQHLSLHRLVGIMYMYIKFLVSFPAFIVILVSFSS